MAGYIICVGNDTDFQFDLFSVDINEYTKIKMPQKNMIRILCVANHAKTMANIHFMLSFRNIKLPNGFYNISKAEINAIFDIIDINKTEINPTESTDKKYIGLGNNGVYIGFGYNGIGSNGFGYNKLIKHFGIKDHLIRHTIKTDRGENTWVVRFMQNGELEFIARPVNQQQHCRMEKFSGFYTLDHLVWYHHNVVNDIPISTNSNILKSTYNPGDNDWAECDIEIDFSNVWIRMSCLV